MPVDGRFRTSSDEDLETSSRDRAKNKRRTFTVDVAQLCAFLGFIDRVLGLKRDKR